MCEEVERYAQQVAAKEREKSKKEREKAEKAAKELKDSIIKMFQDGFSIEQASRYISGTNHEDLEKLYNEVNG